MSGGGGSSPTTSTTVSQNYSPEEAAMRKQVMDEAARIYGATNTSITNAPYPGAKPVPFSSETVAAQDMMKNAAYSMQGTAQGANSYAGFLMGPGQYVSSNPYLQDAMKAAIRPITQAYTDPGGVLANIRSTAIDAGGFNTRSDIAQGIAGRGYLSAVGDVTSKMASQGYEKGLDAGSRALVLAPATSQMFTTAPSIYGAVGAQKENLSQAEEDYAAASRQWGMNAPWAGLQNYANIVFGGASPGTTSTSTGALPRQSPIMGALSGAAMGASIGSMVPGVGTAVGAGIGLLASFL